MERSRLLCHLKVRTAGRGDKACVGLPHEASATACAATVLAVEITNVRPQAYERITIYSDAEVAINLVGCKP